MGLQEIFIRARSSVEVFAGSPFMDGFTVLEGQVTGIKSVSRMPDGQQEVAFLIQKEGTPEQYVRRVILDGDIKPMAWPVAPGDRVLFSKSEEAILEGKRRPTPVRTIGTEDRYNYIPLLKEWRPRARLGFRQK